MRLVDRFIASVSPQWALKRSRAQMLLNRINQINAEDVERLRRTRESRLSANATNQSSAERIRREARWLEETNDIASGGLDALVANTVGNGIQPEPQVANQDGTPATEVNAQLLKLWDDFIYTPEVTRDLDMYTCQQMTARTWFRDGEAFAQHLIGPVAGLDHGTVAPYSLEMLEPDFIPFDINSESERIVQGVKLNAWGRPLGYHILRENPGDRGAYVGSSSATKYVSADRITHIKRVTRFHSVRGVSVFKNSIARFGDLKEIDESERVAARVAAAMAAYIKKGTPDNYEPATDETGEPLPYRQMEIVPGMIFDDLQPGEEVGTIANNRPNNNLIAFRDSQLRSAAAGIGTSWSSLSKNYNGTYSSQRQELVEQYVIYRRLSGQFIFRFCQPIWEGFVTSLVLSSALRIPSSVDRTTLYDCAHSPPPMPWIDPLKEALANELMEKRGYKSRSRIIRERGESPDQVNKEIARDQAELKRLGIELERDGQAAPASGRRPGADDDDDPEDDPDGDSAEIADAAAAKVKAMKDALADGAVVIRRRNK